MQSCEDSGHDVILQHPTVWFQRHLLKRSMLDFLIPYCVMKAAHMSSLSSPQDVVLELDSHLSSRNRGVYHPVFSNVHRTHSRSASWSLSGGTGVRHTEFGRGLVSLNPMTPITNAIREIVPSFGQTSRASEPSAGGSGRATPHISRDPSQTSLLNPPELGEGLEHVEGTSEEHPVSPNGHDSLRTLGDASSNVSVHLPREHAAIPVGSPGTTDEPNMGLELSDSMRWLERNTIFIILLLVKFAWYHRAGLMVILGMFGTFLHCNQVLRNQVALKNRRQISILFLVILFLGANIYFVYYVFWEQRLHLCLIFLAPHFTVDLWNLIWSIWVTDYIIRFGTMALKALVAALFLPLLPTRKKSKYYMLLEYISQFYRTMIPAPLWVRYLSNPEDSGAVFAVLVTAVYLMIKGGIIFISLRDLYRAIVMFVQDQLCGRPPSAEELARAGHQCAICQDEFVKPLILPCQHTFCENCVLQWFDRQNTCPLCRAAIGNYTPKWRDGSTATWPQIF